MSDKTVTLIISDLHVGGGDKDKGDDHVYHKNQLRTFIEEQAASAAGQKGEVELIINGDFLEFAQVLPEIYQLGSNKFWCSEDESMRKLAAIISGHADIFEAFKVFQKTGNVVTIGAGNHDVDLYWPAVQRRLREVGGDIKFETGTVWYSRHEGQLKIGHGHMFDPANKFERWNDPIIPNAENGTARLEMCAGTLFMVKFVNELEKSYPFADNLKPVTSLASILWGENKLGLGVVTWMLLRFAARHPVATAGIEQAEKEVGKRLVQRLQLDDPFAADVTGLYRRVRDASASVETVRLNLNNEEAFFNFMLELLPLVEPDDWTPVFDRINVVGTLAIGDPTGQTLAIKEANKVDKEFLWERAKQELLKDDGPRIVVMGHTHQPDERRDDNGGLYFNPGSWTRYVDYEQNPHLTLEDLKDESKFPYELNYIRIEKLADSSFNAQKITYDSGQ